jgi:hypothetical protein
MAIGYQGEILLEDARDIIDMAEATGVVVPRNKWVTERRMEAEGNAMASMYGI